MTLLLQMSNYLFFFVLLFNNPNYIFMSNSLVNDSLDRKTVLESNLSVFSDICLSLDKLYSYLNFCMNIPENPQPEDIKRFLKSARELYLFSAASLNCIKEELNTLEDGDEHTE